MNLCILLGKIVSEIEFKFIIKSKNNSIAYFELELLNKSIIKVKAYNKMADYVYNELENGNIILINGEVKTDSIIEITEFYIIDSVHTILDIDKAKKKYEIMEL